MSTPSISPPLRAAMLAAAGLTLGATSAWAEPGGTSGAASPAVTKGDLAFELRATTFTGDARDGDWSYRASGAYSFASWWRTGLILRGSYAANTGDEELTSLSLENKFDFTPSRQWWLHLGAQVEYQAGLNGTDDELVVKLLAEHREGPFAARLNLNVVGAPNVRYAPSDESERAYSARFMWRANDRVDLGVEGFGEPDSGAAYWGPRVSVRVGDANLALGYIVGSGNARADSQFRFALELHPQ